MVTKQGFTKVEDGLNGQTILSTERISVWDVDIKDFVWD